MNFMCVPEVKPNCKALVCSMHTLNRVHGNSFPYSMVCTGLNDTVNKLA